MVGLAVMARPRGRQARLVAGLGLCRTSLMAGLVLSPDGCWVGVLRDAWNTVREVVNESHDKGVRAFRLDCAVWRGLFELSTGDYIGLAGRCGTLANGTLMGTI